MCCSVLVSRELQPSESEDREDLGNIDVEVAETEDTSSSMATSVHSLYEHQVDDSLEGAVLSSSAVVSSSEEDAPLSNSRVDQLRRDAVPDGRSDDQPYTEQLKEDIPLPVNPQDVLNHPEDSSVKSGGRSRLIEPVVRSSSRHARSTPSSQQTSPFPRRCLSSPRKSSSTHGSQSSEPSRLILPSTSKTSTPTSVRRSSDTGHHQSNYQSIFVCRHKYIKSQMIS